MKKPKETKPTREQKFKHTRIEKEMSLHDLPKEFDDMITALQFPDKFYSILQSIVDRNVKEGQEQERKRCLEIIDKLRETKRYEMLNTLNEFRQKELEFEIDGIDDLKQQIEDTSKSEDKNV